MTFTSGTLGSYIFGELNSPTTQIFEWDVREPSSPAGTREIYAGHPAWVKELGVTENNSLEFEDVILDYANDDLSGIFQGRVQVWTIGLSNNDFSISNLRIWMPSGTALVSSTSGVADSHIEFSTSGTWFQNPALPSGAGTTMPTSLPTNQNLLRQDGVYGNLDWATDSNVSEFVYMSISVTSGMPLGKYGINSNGDLSFRVTYDWYYKFQSSGSMT